MTRASLAALALATALPAAAQEAPSAEMPYDKRRVAVLGTEMAYVDEGEGPVVLFLHGNPTSSYLWRNVIPHVADDHRAIAPDLIGFGDSAKPDIGYTFADHAAHLDAFVEALGLSDVTLVVHDWGSILGMRHARLNEDAVRGLAFMEAGVPPALPAPSLDAMGPQNAELFAALRSPQGEAMVLEGNFFVEEVLGRIGVVTPLSDEVMAHYREPFPTSESRLPTLVFPRQVPIAGEPADVVAEVEANGEWLYATDLPKLMLHAQPGALMPPPVVAYVEANAANLTAVDLGAGVHFLPEDHPDAIGRALDAWLDTLPE